MLQWMDQISLKLGKPPQMADLMDFPALLCVQETKVVQSIDWAALKSVIADLWAAKQHAEQTQQQTEEQLDALKQQIQECMEAQEARTKGAQVQQDAAGAGTLSHPQRQEQQHADTDSHAPSDHFATPAQVANLQDEVADLNRQVQQLKTAVAGLEQPQRAAHPAASQGHSAVSSDITQAAPAAPSAAPAAITTGAAAAAEDANAADIQALKEQQQQLSGLVASLNNAVHDLEKQVINGQAGKADASLVQGLSDRLSNKADVDTIEHLRKQLADKADRGELDIIMNSMGSTAAAMSVKDDDAAGSATPAHTAAARAALSISSAVDGDTGTGHAAALAALAGQISKLQLQVEMVQERVGKKADGSALSEMSAGLASTAAECSQLSWQLQQLNIYLASAKQQLSDVQQSVKAHLQDRALHSPQQQPAAPASGNTDALAAQLQLAMARLLQLEKQVSTADACSMLGGTAHQHQLQALAPAGLAPLAGGCADSLGLAGQLSELRASVENLQAQVTHLAQQIRPSAVDDGGALPAMAGVADGGQAAGAQRAGADRASQVERTADQSAARLDSTADMDTGDMQTTGGEAPDVADRLAELQLTVESLATSKADKGDLEQLRVMLADTATQSDTDLLRHKLNAQQQLLAQLMQQNSVGSGSMASSPHCEASLRMPCIGGHRASGLRVNTASSVSATMTDVLSPGAALPSPDGAPGSAWSPRNPWGNDKASHEQAQQQHLSDNSTDPDSWQSQVEQQLAGLEQLAQAVCMLATGQMAAASAGGSAVATSNVAAASAGASVPDGSRLPRGPGVHMTRLRRLLQTGAVNRKLDWFDPSLLQKMAQRLAAAEALIKMPQTAGAVSSRGASSPDLEGRVRRLAGEVKVLKERIGAASASDVGKGGWGWRAGDGDHTMLAAKPLGGYRCMACDRPLNSLDVSPGPFIPVGALPISLASGLAEQAAAGPGGAKQLPPAGSRRATAQDAVTLPTAAAAGMAAPTDWQSAAHGLPAELLPHTDVGPKLPPGGWRGVLPRAEDGSVVLPALGAPRPGGAALSPSKLSPRAAAVSSGK